VSERQLKFDWSESEQREVYNYCKYKHEQYKQQRKFDAEYNYVHESKRFVTERMPRKKR
jgi:hypothetical protein